MSVDEVTAVIELRVKRVYLPHIHFIIMTTNRKELNGERNESIQIDLAGPQQASKRSAESKRNGY